MVHLSESNRYFIAGGTWNGSHPSAFDRSMISSTFTSVNWDKVQVEGGRGNAQWRSSGHGSQLI